MRQTRETTENNAKGKNVFLKRQTKQKNFQNMQPTNMNREEIENLSKSITRVKTDTVIKKSLNK